MDPTRFLLEIWLGRGADGIEPAADIDLGMGFAAVVAGVGRVGGSGAPTIDGEVGISTTNDEPVERSAGDDSADFTSVFLQGCHKFDPDGADRVSLVIFRRFGARPHLLPYPRLTPWALFFRRFAAKNSTSYLGWPWIWREHRQVADLLLFYGASKVGGVVHHPDFGDDFADQMSVAEKPHDGTF